MAFWLPKEVQFIPRYQRFLINSADTASAPSLGTATKLIGIYTLMMVDPDVPSGNESTMESLHWIQAGFTSSDTTTIAGQTVFELLNTAITSALAAYIQPEPPARVLFSHRYVQMLLNTTSIDVNATLGAAAAIRGEFDSEGLVKAAGWTFVMGNSFNVTADTSTSGSTSTNSTPSNGESKSGKGSKADKFGNGSSSSFSNSTSIVSAKGTKGSSKNTTSSTSFSPGKNSISSSGSTKDRKNSTSSAMSGVGSAKTGTSGASGTSNSLASNLATSAASTGAGEGNANSSATASSIAGERLGGASSLIAAVGLFAAALVLL